MRIWKVVALIIATAVALLAILALALFKSREPRADGGWGGRVCDPVHVPVPRPGPIPEQPPKVP